MGEQGRKPVVYGATSNWEETDLAGKEVDSAVMEEWDQIEKELQEEIDLRLVSPTIEARVNNLKQRFDRVEMDPEAMCKVYPNEEGIGYEVRDRTRFDGTVEVFREKGVKRHTDDILEKEVYIEWNGPVIGLRNLEEHEGDSALADPFRAYRFKSNLSDKGYSLDNLDVVEGFREDDAQLSITFDLSDTDTIWARNDLTRVKDCGVVGYVEHDIREDIYTMMNAAINNYGDRMADGSITELEISYTGGCDTYGHVTITNPLTHYTELEAHPGPERLGIIEQYLAEHARYTKA